MFDVTWVQHAVGHGGFHTGHFNANAGGGFHWAFDCGSQRTSKFEDYLQSWSRRSTSALDWLFISHFDTDHVSGLNVLMSRVVVKNVMVPYLNERELAYLLLHEIARDNLDRMLVELAADPTSFFVSRGAERVLFLAGGAPDEDATGPEEVSPDYSKETRDRTTSINPRPSPISTTVEDAVILEPSISPEVIEGGVCDVVLRVGTSGVLLKPYRAPAQPRALRRLLEDIQSLIGSLRTGPRLGLGSMAYAIARHARTAAGRAGLRAIYKQHVGSSNRASLSMLSTPIVDAGMKHRWDRHCPGTWTQASNDIPAWLNTGDAELLTPGDLGDWRSKYRNEIPLVRVVALPHHGSDKNSDANFTSLFPRAALVAHARAKSKKHPGDAVIVACGDQLVCVTEDIGSTVTMRFSAH